jgi:signal transduction histidine kinase
MIDRDAFARALGNVLDNALHYSPPGSAIDIIQGEDTNGAFVQVMDDGPGIPPDLLPHIFEPLVRADDARDGRPSGTGLGLSIAARLLQNQGATIDAANTPGRGATFTLRLPTSHESATESARTPTCAPQAQPPDEGGSLMEPSGRKRPQTIEP